MNIRAKFEVRSFTRSWDNRGYWINLGRPWIRPHSLFSQIFNGLLLVCTVWIYLPNLKFVALRVPEIINGYWTNYVMTSPLTSRSLDRLSVWAIYTHYALADCVKIWSNSDKNCRRYSMLKVVMSRLWRHRVTWRHRGGHHSIAPDHFAIGS